MDWYLFIFVKLGEASRQSGAVGLREVLQLLNHFEVHYLIVGGYAVMKYTEPGSYLYRSMLLITLSCHAPAYSLRARGWAGWK